GFFGFFGKNMVEILAAVDTNVPGKSKLAREQSSAERHANAGIGPWNAPLPSAANSSESPELTVKPTAPGAMISVAESKPDLKYLAEQVRSAVIENLSGQVRDAVWQAVETTVGQAMETAVGGVAEKVEAAVSRLASSSQGKGAWSQQQQKIYDRLVRADMDPPLARQVLVRLHSSGASSEAAISEQLPEVIAHLISVSGPIMPLAPGRGPKVIALIGPTGVGKTTTIAKLAATYRLTQAKSIGLVTIDTYRIAAVEQLKVYGDIIGVPVEVVLTPGALREALHKMHDCDLVLLDTAGRSPSHKLHISELRSFVEGLDEREIHLVLAATASRVNLLRAIESFSLLGIDRLLFTKIDEAANLGALISVAHAADKPLSYITVGQSVPDDLQIAEARQLADLLLR
ncbi:MAG: flagellar biosynthesis protein FlhF, partial [Cyanobacteria bacterium NC_groundwater_1444_Ag_S-0.65um_54_12]|nr:flagellar biosynthesis protein FlhF [Cyanobacteria bacterium NC_groundwater_1444_Ag_S-0.65um_54_12]